MFGGFALMAMRSESLAERRLGADLVVPHDLPEPGGRSTSCQTPIATAPRLALARMSSNEDIAAVSHQPT